MFEILEADIVVLQETKIQRKDLRDDMVLVPGWDCYFSLPRVKKGKLQLRNYLTKMLMTFRVLWCRNLYAQCYMFSYPGRRRHNWCPLPTELIGSFLQPSRRATDWRISDD
jgi:hypothetical protein